jgi:myosin heavy subunit
MVFGRESGEVVERAIRTQRSEDGDFPNIKLANEDLETRGSEGEASVVDDLIRLTHLHEPAILHTLELRYWK